MNMDNGHPEAASGLQGVDAAEIYEIAMKRDDILRTDSSSSIAYELRSLEERYGKKKPSGQGGMKKIYRVEDRLTGRYVAMAELSNQEDPGDQDRFLREARLTASLEHPNIMPIYDLGFNEQGCPFFTMKYTGDQNLNQLLKKVQQKNQSIGDRNTTDWPLLERMNLFIGICEGMAYAHSRNILHLDLKPHNILVGDFGEVLICDWGLGKVLFEEDVEKKRRSPQH